MLRVRTLTRTLFGAAIVCALGFGASGAVAMPVETSQRICKPQDAPQCRADCIAAGAWTGVCSGGECECLW